jgi:DNA-binding transcriptional LysR family regulator
MPDLDLNLIRSFIALYETGSVTAAAHRMHVTQPSMSYGLARLRERLADPLFRRGRAGMEPTAVATTLYAPLRESLAGIDQALERARVFEPAHSEQRFRIALSDLGELTLLPTILEQLRRAAPAVEIVVVPLEIGRVGASLARGEIDLAICSRALDRPDLERAVLLDERYVCLARADHPRLGRVLDLETFLDEAHVLVDPTSGHGLAEEVLRDMGIRRKIRVVVPHFSSLPQLVSGSDLLAILPQQIATRFSRQAAFRIDELPFVVPEFEVALYAHVGIQRSAAHRWFRDAVLKAARTAVARA